VAEFFAPAASRSHEVAKVAVGFQSGDGHTPIMPQGELDAANLLGQRVADAVNKFRA
jgi:hypothetical protein